MRSLIWAGRLMVALGAAMLAGSIAAGSPPFGVLMLAGLAGPGLFMVWLARGWDRPLEGPADLHRFGRPANATVRQGRGLEARCGRHPYGQAVASRDAAQ